MVPACLVVGEAQREAVQILAILAQVRLSLYGRVLGGPCLFDCNAELNVPAHGSTCEGFFAWRMLRWASWHTQCMAWLRPFNCEFMMWLQGLHDPA